MTTSKPKLRTGTRMSAAEYLELPDIDEYRWLELDDGALYFMPRPRRAHLFVSARLTAYFDNHLESFDDPPAEVYTELVIIISRETGRILIPDFSIFLRSPGDDSDISSAGNIPDIVIEILSTDRSRDLVRKRQLYAEAGIREYWIFDPQNDTVLPLELQDGEYIERPTLTAADTLTTPLLPGLSIPLADIFQPRRRPPRDE
ncbi:MAG: Uma2 family endonuclease [Chloroflexi bacterium]|nr:Uma2 family endonuclease [Chloroflexota bacterium]